MPNKTQPGPNGKKAPNRRWSGRFGQPVDPAVASFTASVGFDKRLAPYDIRASLAHASKHAALVMPGMTHLQVAQPVTFGHHLLAYGEMLQRDRERLADCRRRVNRLPLGAAALAGTTFPIDRAQVARELGFEALCE